MPAGTETELRLRGAEKNLERLEDIVGALEEQHRLLKRQSRQATRYRNLSDHIKQHEAILLHLRWTTAQSERAAAAEHLGNIETLVTELTHEVANATTGQLEVSSVLPDLRQKEGEEVARLQRILVKRDALDAEEDRIESLRREIQHRINQIDADREREKTLGNDAAEAIENLENEATAIRTAQASEADDLSIAKNKLVEAETDTESRERMLTDLTQAVVADETQSAALKRQLTEFEGRRKRLCDRRERIICEQKEAIDAADGEAELEIARNAAETARQTAADARTALQQAEAKTAEMRAAENDAREEYQNAGTAAAKLRAEQEALAEIIEFGDPQLWPPMIDAVEVEAGYEVALGAALGDDLIAPTDEASPIHWRTLPMFTARRELPKGVRSLSEVVRGPAALMRRLSQIGLVDNDAEGQRLHNDLEQGQRLVSMQGALWRWDGYTVTAGAPTSAATRLAKRNRLEDMRVELHSSDAKAANTLSIYELSKTAARNAGAAERQAREAVWSADAKAQETNDEAATLAEKTAEARSRISSLKNCKRRFGFGSC